LIEPFERSGIRCLHCSIYQAFSFGPTSLLKNRDYTNNATS
jgi:hypothetical protein